MQNFFDVVILSLGRPDFTIQAIRSILEQAETRFHIWVIDQGSEASELALLEDFLISKNHVKLVKLGKNLGVAGGRNIGMKMGTAPFIVSIDNDAVIEDPLLFVKIKNTFEDNPQLGIIGFKVNNYYSKDLDKTSWAYPKTLLKNQNEKFITTRFVGAGHAIRRNVISETDFYDENLFFYWEELDLAYQVINRRFFVIYEPSFIVYHKISPEKRVHWRSGRFYYLVRNALYLDYKYFGKYSRVLILSLGYFLKSLVNGISLEGIRGIRDSISMMKKLDPNRERLNDYALNYIREYDTKVRGHILKRIISEVLVKI